MEDLKYKPNNQQTLNMMKKKMRSTGIDDCAVKRLEERLISRIKVDALSFWAFWTFSISLKHYVPKKSKAKKNHEILKPKTTLKQKIKSRMRR